MDIWAWVERLYDELNEAGQDRVAGMLYSLPELACEDKVEQAEALFPEALAAAKALKNPWMEVFFRHWQMRLKLRSLAQGEVALSEAVSLVEFAHRKECADCPQSVCTTQDISACYSNVDGPGWAEERKAVCVETLARIDPTWNCYLCLSHEYADALSDQGEHEKALAYQQEAMRAFAEAGKEVQRHTYYSCVTLLRRAGRLDEAWQAFERVGAMSFEMDEDDGDRRDAAILRARLLADSGRYDEAREALPAWNELPPGDYVDVLEIYYRLALAMPEKNSWSLGSLFQEGAAYMHKVGAHRDLIRLCELHTRLALLRGARETARRALALMEEHLPRLRAPLGADALLTELRAALSTAPPPDLPVPAEELIEHLVQNENRDPEREVELLRVALAQRPDDVDLVSLTASALKVMEAQDEARALLWETMERFPHMAEDLIGDLIPLIPEQDTQTMARLATLMERDGSDLELWVRAHSASRAEAWAEAGKHLDEFIAGRSAPVIGARRFRAEIALKDKDFATAIRMRQESIALMREKEEDPAIDQWDLIVAASADQNWALVRETSIEIGLEGIEPGDAPLELDGAYVRIRYREDGDWQDYVAVRTGPATARISEVSVPGSPQHAGDLVVFDPAALESEPEDEEERERFATPYHHVHTLSPGGFTAWVLDGPDPDMEEWTPFKDALVEKGCLLWICSGSGYRVTDPDAPAEEDTEEADDDSGSALDPDAADPAAEDAPEEEEDDDDDDDDDADEEGASDEDGDEEGLPGIYIALGAPAAMSPKELDRLLLALTQDWKRPLSWLALAKAAGSDEQRHKDIIDRYGL